MWHLSVCICQCLHQITSYYKATTCLFEKFIPLKKSLEFCVNLHFVFFKNLFEIIIATMAACYKYKIEKKNVLILFSIFLIFQRKSLFSFFAFSVFSTTKSNHKSHLEMCFWRKIFHHQSALNHSYRLCHRFR
jgi:hypothetical protein